MSRRRWDNDVRGIGTEDARAWRPLVETLATVVDEEGWVAEGPELHLLPHLESAAAAGPLAMRGSRTDADGTFVVDLGWVGPSEPSRLAIRSAMYALIATVAESVTVLHEPPEARGRIVDVLSGSVDGDGPFAGHGHTVRLEVSDPDTAQPSSQG
jgi:hypothetical protein